MKPSLSTAFAGAAAAALIHIDQISPREKRTPAFYVNNMHQGLAPADPDGCSPDAKPEARNCLSQHLPERFQANRMGTMGINNMK